MSAHTLTLQDIGQGTRQAAEAHAEDVREVARFAYLESRRIMGEARPNAEMLVHAAASTLAEVDRHAEEVLAKAAARGRRVGCRQGCTHCCHQHLFPGATELALIALAVMPEERPGLLERARASAARVRDLSHHERFAKAIPCVLLEGSSCGAYQIRPQACRSYFSTSKLACDKDWTARFRPSGGPGRKGVPLLQDPQLYGTGIVLGLELALFRHGLEMEQAELAAGLVTMLEDNGAERWLAGERVLAPVRHMGLADAAGGEVSAHANAVTQLAEHAKREGWWLA